MTLRDLMQTEKSTIDELLKQGVVERQAKLRGMKLKTKKPRLTQLLGESHPFSGEDAELLRQYFRITRG